jgi:hypothetical protein
VNKYSFPVFDVSPRVTQNPANPWIPPDSHMKRLALLFFCCVSSQTMAREAQLPEPDTLQRLRAGEIILENTRTDESGGATQVLIFMDTSVERIWEVIYSCENAFIYVDGLKLCEVLEDDGVVTLTRQVVKKGWLIPTQDYTFRTLREPFKHAEFQRTEGNPKVMEGSWDFITLPQGVVVIHEIRVEPDMAAPRFLVRRWMRRGMPEMMSCIRGLAGGSLNAELEARDLGFCPGERAESK